jgi:hypothetical protein
MPRVQVVTKKYNVTLKDPKTGEETTTVATEEVGGIPIEQAFAPLGMQIVKKELIEAIEENVHKAEEEEAGKAEGTMAESVRRRVIQSNPQAMQPQQTMQPRGPQTQVPIQNIPEKIIQHGDVRLKLVGDKAFVEEWVEKDSTENERQVYKIIGKDGKEITSNVVILHKEWVELKEEKQPEPEVESEPEEAVLPNITDLPTVPNVIEPNGTTDDQNLFGNMVNDLIQDDD